MFRLDIPAFAFHSEIVCGEYVVSRAATEGGDFSTRNDEAAEDGFVEFDRFLGVMAALSERNRKVEPVFLPGLGEVGLSLSSIEAKLGGVRHVVKRLASLAAGLCPDEIVVGVDGEASV